MSIDKRPTDSKNPSYTPPYLIDTHTHFDDGVFDDDRHRLATSAYDAGLHHLILIGYLAKYFDRMLETKQQLLAWQNDNGSSKSVPTIIPNSYIPNSYIAFGLHPAYIHNHTDADLDTLSDYLNQHEAIAIGEIGLDTYTDALKEPKAIQKQERFFNTQLDLAVQHNLPVLLHIRKAHAESLALLKNHSYDAKKLGGIAHSFSGGEQEAKAFVKLGFKLGVTGQFTNPNAKKLHRAIAAAVDEYGIDCLVIETDCPDMTPISCQLGHSHTRNVPENLVMVLKTLSEAFDISEDVLARKLWENSCEALKVDWQYPEL